MRLYLDACIWRDYWENRRDSFRPLGEWAFRLLQRCVKEQLPVLYSQWLLDELEKYYLSTEVKKMFAIIPAQLLKEVPITRNELLEAKLLSQQRKIPFGDAVHAILARNNVAILVLRDKHFFLVTDIVDVCLPEDLL